MMGVSFGVGRKQVSALRIRKGTQLNKDNLTEKGDYPALNGGISSSGYTETEYRV